MRYPCAMLRLSQQAIDCDIAGRAQRVREALQGVQEGWHVIVILSTRADRTDADDDDRYHATVIIAGIGVGIGVVILVI